MARSFRALKDKLEIYFFNSQEQMMRTAEDYIAQHPTEVNRINDRGMPDSSIIAYARDKKLLAKYKNFVGYDINSPLSIAEQYSYDQLKMFSDMPLLTQAIEKFDIIKRSLDLGGDFDASKMKFTSLPRGVFNFGLASKGLIRKTEYYDVERNTVIDEKIVKEETLNNNKIFYYLSNGSKRLVRKQQKGTMLVKNNYSDIIVNYNENQKIWLPYKDGKVFNGKGKNMLKYSTTTKKVYMYREKLGGGVSPYVDLFVGVNGLENLDTENMLAKNLSAFIVADVLEKAGVKVRIYGLRSYKDVKYDGDGEFLEDTQTVFIAYALKEYGEQIDFGRLASFTSDKRFFRVNLWRIASTLRKKETGDYREGKGMSLYGGDDDLYPAFLMFKNWLFNQKGTLKYDTKITDKNLMVLSGLPSVSKYDLLTGSNADSTFKKIEQEVYRTLDYVGMLLTKNPKAFVGKIYEREKKNPRYYNPNYQIKEYLENLIRSNLAIVPLFDEKNKESNENRFSTPLNEIPRITERTNELVDVIDNVIR
jgi:hypothetical protein